MAEIPARAPAAEHQRIAVDYGVVDPVKVLADYRAGRWWVTLAPDYVTEDTPA